MRTWSLRTGDPLALILASDARLGPTDYLDDQIWEFSLTGGDPPAVSLNTTYGLRAKAARLFWRFSLGDETRNDPAEFARPPEIIQIFPNFAALRFAPFADIEVESEIWVPHSHAITERVTIHNRAQVERRLRIELVGQLTPMDGQRLAPFETETTTLLSGFSGGLAPVIFMTGGAKSGPGPYPSLAHTWLVGPDEARQVQWVQVALADREASFAMARDIAAQNWEAEKSRLEMLNSGQVEVFCGEPAWDAAFMLAQKQAVTLLLSPTEYLPHHSFVITRQPDQGFSRSGDGADYNHLWNGQTVLEADYLAQILLPSAAEVVKGLVRNFLAVQEPNGAVDWKPGLGGQRGRLLATPLLVNLVWRIYEQTDDAVFLAETFPGLLKFWRIWFERQHDRDGDGIPEWDHLLQAGLEYHPVYGSWQENSQGVDIFAAETPALSALLFAESEHLQQIAQIIGDTTAIDEITARAETLRDRLESSWQEANACYFDWDRDTHLSTAGETIAELKGSGIFLVRRDFEQPARFLIQILTDETIRRTPTLFLHGKSASGRARIERINDDQIRWMPGFGRLTGAHLYSRLERIEVLGLEPEDRLVIRSLDFHLLDITQLAPLWARIPAQERAVQLVQETLTYPTLYWREYGLPTCPQPTPAMDQQSCWSLNLPWNTLIGAGLLRYDQRALAAALVTKLMTAITQSLRKDHAFRRGYHAETGQGQGEFHALNGIAPLGLFLDVLGVKLISPRRVKLSGFNPFPWPVTVKYRGLTVMRQKDKTVVIFPDNQTVTVSDPEPRVVSLE